MGRGPFGQFVQRIGRPVRELLQDKELSEADPELRLDATRVEPQRPHDAAYGVHGAGDVVWLRHWMIELVANTPKLPDRLGSEQVRDAGRDAGCGTRDAGRGRQESDSGCES